MGAHHVEQDPYRWLKLQKSLHRVQVQRGRQNGRMRKEGWVIKVELKL